MIIPKYYVQKNNKEKKKRKLQTVLYLWETKGVENCSITSLL